MLTLINFSVHQNHPLEYSNLLEIARSFENSIMHACTHNIYLMQKLQMLAKCSVK